MQRGEAAFAVAMLRLIFLALTASRLSLW